MVKLPGLENEKDLKTAVEVNLISLETDRKGQEISECVSKQIWQLSSIKLSFILKLETTLINIVDHGQKLCDILKFSFFAFFTNHVIPPADNLETC